MRKLMLDADIILRRHYDPSFSPIIRFRTSLSSVVSESTVKYAMRIAWNRTLSGPSLTLASAFSSAGFLSPAFAGHGARRRISWNPTSIIALGKICSLSGLTSLRKSPDGWADGLSDLNRGLKTRASALTGLFCAGQLATHWIKLPLLILIADQQLRLTL